MAHHGEMSFIHILDEIRDSTFFFGLEDTCRIELGDVAEMLEPLVPAPFTANEGRSCHIPLMRWDNSAMHARNGPAVATISLR